MASELDFLLLKSPLLSRRQAMGIFFALCIICGGQMIRHYMLIGPDGQWQENLWLASAVYAGEESGKRKKEVKIVLTTPLPINSCSVDSLTLLPGVGKVLAGRIEEARVSGLVFRQPDDLKLIKGIGPAMCLKLSPHVIFRKVSADSIARSVMSPE